VHAPSTHACHPSPGSDPGSNPSLQRNGRSPSSESKLRARRAEGAAQKATARKPYP
jgi:hypothetical protein